MWILFLSTIFPTGFCAVISMNASDNGSNFPKIGDRVTGGKTIEIDKVPHQVYIETLTTCDANGTNCESFSCGGSIIHPWFILTAAHCLFRENPLAGVDPNATEIRVHGPNSTVRVGSSHSDKGGKEIPGRRNVVHWKFHKELEIDLALILLNESIKFGPPGKAPQLIRIPKSEDEFQRKWDKGPCWVSGFGDTNRTEYWERFMDPTANARERLYKPREDVELRQAELIIVNKTDCQKMYQDFSDPVHNHTDVVAEINEDAKSINEYVVCAYGQGQRDSCEGDSGGPLTCFEKKSGNPMLYGTVKDGRGCAPFGLPGFYMRAPKLRVWIKQFVQKYIPKNESLAPFD